MPNSESRWFKIVSFVVTGIIAGLLLANIIYFNELRSGARLSSGEITSMLVISGILFAIVISVFMWALIRLFVHKDTRKAAVTTVQGKTMDWINSTDSGITKSGVTTTVNRFVRTTPSAEAPRPATISASLS